MTHNPRHLAVLLALTAVAAGCGQGSSSAGAPPANDAPTGAVLARAAEATAHAGTARFTLRIAMQTEQGAVAMHGAGALSLGASHRATLSLAMRLPGLPAAVAMQERIVGPVVYMHAPALTRAIPGAKPWLKVDTSALAGSAGVGLSSLMTSSSNDPTQALSYLRTITAGVQVVGPETVDGVRTMHYRASIDLYKLADRLPVASRAGYLRLMGADDRSTAPLDVWVDGRGLLRQERFQLRMPAVDATMTLVLKLTRFGMPVHVAAPPARLTSDFRKLLGNAAGA